MASLWPGPSRTTAPVQAHQTPSLESILSIEERHSNDDLGTGEWVLFSPEISPTGPTENDVLSQQTPGDIEVGSVRTCGPELGTPVASPEPAGLELPGHNGAGAFSRKTKEHRDMMNRVNEWRLGQSELVISELQRLERKFFPQYLEEDSPGPDAGSRGCNPSRWNQITRTLMARIDSIISFDDQVLDFLFKNELPELPEQSHSQSRAPGVNAASPVDPSVPAVPSLPTHPLVGGRSEHFERACSLGPREWDTKLVSRLFEELGIKGVPGFLKYFLAWQTPCTDTRAAAGASGQQPLRPAFVDPGYFWDDFDTSSMSTSVH